MFLLTRFARTKPVEAGAAEVHASVLPGANRLRPARKAVERCIS